MPDMLVKLYDIPDDWGFIRAMAELGVTIRKPLSSEKNLILDWIRREFSENWAAETEYAMMNRPIACFVAVRGLELLGFGCYDTAALGMFGPTGVQEAARGQGIGGALLLACLLDMKLRGYAYAVIGWVGPAEFYTKVAGAVLIPDSEPSIWKTWLFPRHGE